MDFNVKCVVCRIQLETRIALQFENATLQDVLIPVKKEKESGNIFMSELGSMERILKLFLTRFRGLEEVKSTHMAMLSATAKLWDGYLAEVAFHTSLTPGRFGELVERIPPYMRPEHDHVYKAIHSYIKVLFNFLLVFQKSVANVTYIPFYAIALFWSRTGTPLHHAGGAAGYLPNPKLRETLSEGVFSRGSKRSDATANDSASHDRAATPDEIGPQFSPRSGSSLLPRSSLRLLDARTQPPALSTRSSPHVPFCWEFRPPPPVRLFSRFVPIIGLLGS